VAAREDIAASATRGVNIAISLLVAAFVGAIVYFVADKFGNATGSTEAITKFFGPIVDNWPLFVTIGMIGAALVVLVPTIKKLYELRAT